MCISNHTTGVVFSGEFLEIVIHHPAKCHVSIMCYPTTIRDDRRGSKGIITQQETKEVSTLQTHVVTITSVDLLKMETMQVIAGGYKCL